MIWLKKNAFNVISLIVGILGVLSSYYFYSISTKVKEPVIIEKSNVQIFSPEFSQSNRFSFVDETTGLKVTNSVFFQEFSIWNKGKEIIRNSDILSPISISYDDDVELIDVSIVAATRPNIVNASYQKNSNSLDLSFSIMEHNDGFKLQVLYASKNKSNAKISGDIAGVTKFYTFGDLTTDNIFLGLGKIILWLFIALFGLLIIFGFMEIGGRLVKRVFPDNYEIISKRISKALGYFWIVFMVVMVFVLLGSQAYDFAKSEALDSAPAMIETTKVNVDTN